MQCSNACNLIAELGNWDWPCPSGNPVRRTAGRAYNSLVAIKGPLSGVQHQVQVIPHKDLALSVGALVH